MRTSVCMSQIEAPLHPVRAHAAAAEEEVRGGDEGEDAV